MKDQICREMASCLGSCCWQVSEGSEKDKESQADSNEVRLLSDSPFRIFKLAERGDCGEFSGIIEKDPKKVSARDNVGKTPAHHAAAGNHVGILEIIVEHGGNLNTSDYKGNSALHLAIEAEAVEAVEFLARNKANLRHLNGKRQTPLHVAAILNKPNCISAMSKFVKRPDVDQGDEHGRTALHLACMYDHEECVKILLEDLKASPRKVCAHKFYPIHEAAKHGASRSLGALLTLAAANGCPREEMILFYDAEGNMPLHSAVHGGDIQTVKLCLLSGAKISIQQQDLSTAVHLACTQGALEIVKLMFTIQPDEKETALNTCDLQRMTPLHYAAMYDHAELVEYLIQEGACLDAIDKKKNSPLQLASSRKAWQATRVLIRNGANAKLEDENGRSFLHSLVKYDGKFADVFEENIEVSKVVNVNMKDKNGWTALHLAGKHGNVEGFSNLLALGADIFAENIDGENVFHIACRFGRLHIVERILKIENLNNSIINEGNGNGLTPFHISALAGHCDVLRLLMKKGALLHRDYDGCTPIHLAAQNGHTDSMKLILNTHSHLLDLADKFGNTPLHIAARYNQPRAVSLLLKLDCKLTYNQAGFSAIDYALQKKFVDVIFLMVTDAKRGSDVLSMTGGKHPVIMSALIAKLPNVAKVVLDQNIMASDTKQDSKKFNIKYDFKWFSLPKEEINVSGEVSKCAPRRHPVRPEKIFLPILNEMVEHKRVDLLSHDLSQRYLEMKWNGSGKYFQVFNLLLYCFYLTLVTNYCISPWTKDDQFFATWNELHGFNNSNSAHEDVVNERIKDILASNDTILPMAPTDNVAQQEIDFFNYLRYYYQETDVEDIVNLYDFAVGFNRVAIPIFVISVSMMLLEFINIWRYGLRYCFSFDTWVWYGVNAANFVMSVLPWLTGREMVNPSAALSAFLSWFYLLLILQRFDVVGIYVTMFMEILRSLVRVLLIFSVLIIGFGLTFYILLSNGNHLVFTDLPLSIMRTFSMMLGDLDFMNTFGFPHHCQLLEALNMTHIKMYSKLTECRSSRRLPYPIMSFTMVGLYMILNCILLVNLLIGLAVGDIDTVKRNAQLKRLAMQVQMQTNLERTIPSMFLKRFDKPYVVVFPNVQQKKLNPMDKIVEFFHPKSPPSDDTKELVQYSAEILDGLSDAAHSIESLREDIASIKSWIDTVNGNLKMIGTALKVPHSDMEGRILTVSTPRKLRRSSTKVVPKKARISIDGPTSSDSE